MTNSLVVEYDIIEGHVTMYMWPHTPLRSHRVYEAITKLPYEDVILGKNAKGELLFSPYADALWVLEAMVHNIECHASGAEFVAVQMLDYYWQNRKPGNMAHNYELILNFPSIEDDTQYVLNQIKDAFMATRNKSLPLAPTILTKEPVTAEEKKKGSKPSKS